MYVRQYLPVAVLVCIGSIFDALYFLYNDSAIPSLYIIICKEEYFVCRGVGLIWVGILTCIYLMILVLDPNEWLFLNDLNVIIVLKSSCFNQSPPKTCPETKEPLIYLLLMFEKKKEIKYT